MEKTWTEQYLEAEERAEQRTTEMLKRLAEELAQQTASQDGAGTTAPPHTDNPSGLFSAQTQEVIMAKTWTEQYLEAEERAEKRTLEMLERLVAEKRAQQKASQDGAGTTTTPHTDNPSD